MAQEEYEEKDLRTHIYETTDTYAGSDQMIKAPLATMKEVILLLRLQKQIIFL